MSTDRSPTVTTAPDGVRYWRIGDVIHREDGPAIEWPDGTGFWYLHGRLHREDGPAVELPDGSGAWYIDGRPSRSSLRDNPDQPH